jgi:hypothetical protein
MAKFAQPRELKPNEKALIDFLLIADFPGRNELQQQVECVQVVGDCDCGCGTIDLAVTGPCVRAGCRERVPVEAYGDTITVLLFVRDGLLSSLEIVNCDDSRPLVYPSPDGLKLSVPAARELDTLPNKQKFNVMPRHGRVIR